jgi:hypothetical protein
MQKEELPFVDIGFDFMAYTCGINTLEMDPKAFERIKFSVETEALSNGIQKFAAFIRRTNQI